MRLRDIFRPLVKPFTNLRQKYLNWELNVEIYVRRNNPARMSELIAKGADPNHEAGGGKTPLMHAMDGSIDTTENREMLYDIMKTLIKGGADVNKRAAIRNAQTPMSALEESLYLGDLGITKILLDAGADIYTAGENGKKGETLIEMARTHKGVHPAMLALLEEKERELKKLPNGPKGVQPSP